LRKINKTDKTEEYDYNNNKFDLEGEYRQQQQRELDEELGVFIKEDGFEKEKEKEKEREKEKEKETVKEEEGDDGSTLLTGRREGGTVEKRKGRERSANMRKKGKERGSSKGGKEVGEGEEDSDEDVYDYSEGYDDDSEDSGYVEAAESASDDDEKLREARKKQPKRKKESLVKQNQEKGNVVYVYVQREGKLVKVKKRNPIRLVDIQKELKSNWWKEVKESVERMAGKCYLLNENSPEISARVGESFLQFLSTGFNGIPKYSSPLTFWTNVRHDKSLQQHRDLAELALCLVGTMASEAPCERVFSKMKMMIGDHRFNLSPKTIFHMFVIAGS
jgi:hypothetical protein